MNLIQTQPVSARSRSFVEAEVVCIVFESNPLSLEAYGLGALESVVKVNSQGKVFVPVVNSTEMCTWMKKPCRVV